MFNDPADAEGFRIRRARLGFSGRLFQDFSYYLAIDLKDAVEVATGELIVATKYSMLDYYGTATHSLAYRLALIEFPFRSSRFRLRGD